jgi:hypothetical protein
VVPWSAVYVVACDDGRGVLYSEDVPPDVTVIAARTTSDAPPPDMQLDDPDMQLQMEEEAAEMDIPRRLLRSVPADAAATGTDFAAPIAARRRRRQQHRLVK